MASRSCGHLQPTVDRTGEKWPETKSPSTCESGGPRRWASSASTQYQYAAALHAKDPVFFLGFCVCQVTGIYWTEDLACAR